MKAQVYALLLVLLAHPAFLRAQGFGLMQKKEVTINRLLPPTVNLNGKRIRVEATVAGTQKDTDQLQSLLKTKLVTLIQKDPRFIVDEGSPQTTLKFTITNFYLEKVASGTNATRTVSNRGKIEVAYQAIDMATDSALDSENLSTTAGYEAGRTSFLGQLAFEKDKKKQAAESSENETRDQLVDGIVASMAKRIAPLDQPFQAPLPGGKLEPLSSLARTGRWGALEEQAEKTDKFPKPTDDSYRLYLVALAKESQAYDLTREANDRDLGKRTDITATQAEAEFKKAQADLDEAGTIYKQIITANSKEKDFRDGDARTEEALAIYAKIERYKAENAKALANKQAQLAKAKVAEPDMALMANHHSNPLVQVLDFCNRGLPIDSIRDYIDSPDFLADAHASNYKFNFAQDPLRLHETCKQNGPVLQRLIRARLSVQSGQPIGGTRR